MPHPLVAQLYFTRREWLRALEGVTDEDARRRFQSRFAHLVEAEVRHNAGDDPLYDAVDPEVFGRAVVGAVHEAVAHFLTVPDYDSAALIRGLSAVFAPEH